MRCEFCCTHLVKRASTGDWHCPSCELYNAAVAALKAAAESIARNRQPKAKDAWLNEYGVFAWVDGVVTQLGAPEETAPFVALTKAATRVTTFLDETQISGSAA
jgi:hypothetical protein